MAEIKIRKNQSSDREVAEDCKLDLRNNNIKANQKQLSKKWLFLTILIIIIVVGAGVNYWILSSKKTDFTDLLSEETVVFSIINQDVLYSQVSPFWQFLEQSNFYGQKAINQFNNYLNKAQLDFESDIQPFFEKDLAFILMPSNSETDFPFAFILKRKNLMAQISQVLDKIEPEFKNDFNFSSQVYRQIEITSLKSFSSSLFNYVYAQAENYFIVSNSQDCLKDIINNIIDK